MQDDWIKSRSPRTPVPILFILILQSVVGDDPLVDQSVFDYVNDFYTSVRFGDHDVPKTNSDVKTSWSHCTLTTQVPSYHFHSKAVRDIFQSNTEFDQANTL
eukprot:TRINITY_DN9583_c0_g1_i1.p1 TRINITY_DN9583_c0_g1~~TRINITY_DN9583_c0_g1_i1.p1  ORF type:complete len:102 (+),score=6.48 TRINITY_DN9583_c0_g1_i1:302-607(+)